MKNKDIIIVGQQPWDTDIGSNCKNIALEMSKHNRVLYVNSPLDRITKFRAKDDPRIQRRINVIQKKEQGLIKIKENLWNYYPDCLVESINWIDNTTLFTLFNKMNNRKLAKSIMKAIDKLNLQDYILFNDNEIFKGFYLNEYLRPELSIYYSRDYMVGVDYWKKHGKQLEPILIGNNDLCVANSAFLADYCKQFNPNSFYVGQGCEVEAFTKGINSLKPSDLLGVARPIIGYVGSLNSERLDIQIIESLATHYPDFSVVLVGPEDDSFKMSSLHQLENVFFLGSKPVSELPAYINAFDICINPQLVNEITIGNYPRKIDEYLAMGKPVIATKTKAMESFADHVYLAETENHFLELVEQAILDNNDIVSGKRKGFVATHTWTKSVAEIYSSIKKSRKKDRFLSIKSV